MAELLHVLLVEDSEDDALLLERALQQGGFAPVCRRVESAEALAEALQAGRWDIVLADYALPRLRCEEVLATLQAREDDLPVIVVSGAVGEDTAAALMRQGACDFLLKDHLHRLAPAVRRELREAQERRARRLAEQTLRESEATLRGIFRAAPIGIGMAQDRILRWVNRHLCEMTGYRIEELVGRSARMLYASEAAYEAAGAAYARLAREGTAQTETLWRRKDGSVLDVLLSVAANDPHDPSAGITFTALDITERRRTEEAIRRYQARLRDLAAELVQAEQRERRRLAADLHDEVGQALATAKMQIQSLEAAVEGESLARTLAQVRALVEQAIEHTRHALFELSPPVLYELGLEAALESLTERTGALHGLEATFEDDGAEKPLGEAVRVALFRAVRELLHNVVRHARASRMAVRVGRENDAVRIEVEDDGVGFDPATVTAHGGRDGGFGLFEIRERCDYLGGKAEIFSRPGAGTRVVLTVPLEPSPP